MSGIKINDTQQEQSLSQTQTWACGTTWEVYSTPSNQRTVLKHASGSHIEFKADGSIFIKSIKDLQLHSSILSSQNSTLEGADSTTQRIDTDLDIEVAGRLSIKCAVLDVEVGSTARVKAGTDVLLSGNNVVTRATESVSLEGQKTVYIDAKELKERVVTRKSEVGSAEDSPPGGTNYMNVYGNTIINNADPRGGITIAAAGYLNLVCGQERVDIIGQYTKLPSVLSTGTFTTIVKAPTPPMPENKSTAPGDISVTATTGGAYQYLGTMPKSTLNPAATLSSTVTLGNEMHTVAAGNRVTEIGLAETEMVGTTRLRTVGGAETVTIGGIQKITAAQIFLN